MWSVVVIAAVTLAIVYHVGVFLARFCVEMSDGSNSHSGQWPPRDGQKAFMVMEDIDGAFWWIGKPRTGTQGAIIAPGKEAPTADRTDVVYHTKNRQVYDLLDRAVKIDNEFCEDECSGSHPIYRFPQHPRRALWTNYRPVPNNLQEACDLKMSRNANTQRHAD
jgi:hypothetical protein